MASQPYLDPLNQAFADMTAAGPGLDELPVEELRESLEKLNEHEKLPGVDRNMVKTPVAGGIDTWIYTPTGAKGPLPYVFYVHGGGWMVGNINFYDSIATDLVLRTGYAVVFPEYALSPEVKWPTQQEQCFKVLEWMVQCGSSHDLIPDKFALVGDSAGGHLIFNINVMAQQKGLNIPYNILLCPAASMDYRSQPTPSRYEFWNGPFLTEALMERFVNIYAPDGTVDRTSELASPSTALSDAVAAQFAPTLIVTSSADVLRDEAETLGERLQRAGRDVAVFRAHGQVHDPAAIDMIRNGPTPKMIMTLITAALKERLD
ncbi:AB hydrolase superfamily protein [Apiospora rasikravindrae]|uniref:AB hydrolase superfamily protein n=1 Tax=Apiospora rasikravindrae TaxID=990691 RepID=A0ABR1SX77_9PEZI